MKNLLFVIITIASLISCSKKDGPISSEGVMTVSEDNFSFSSKGGTEAFTVKGLDWDFSNIFYVNGKATPIFEGEFSVKEGFAIFDDKRYYDIITEISNDWVTLKLIGINTVEITVNEIKDNKKRNLSFELSSPMSFGPQWSVTININQTKE